MSGGGFEDRRSARRPPRLAVLLALALAAWEIVPAVRSLREGEHPWLEVAFVLLYSASALLLARGSKVGASIALLAALPAIALRVWTAWSVLLSSSEGLEAEQLAESLSFLPENLFVAACNVLLIHDAFAKPPDPNSAAVRLSRFRALPGWAHLAVQLTVGVALLCLAALGGPERWRYGKIATALFGTALVILATAMVVAKAADTVGSHVFDRRAAS